ncbi:MAG TPA: homocysteine S-methyltransferase family protein [Myxococcales bacterium]|nr:homocysteine S-methyltransferase family protein [Myxococcales bacterium]
MIVLDGAMGTELGRRGVDTRGALFSAAALLDEQGRACVRGVHLDYVAAGAQVVTACTFRTNPRKAGARWRELTFVAVQLARESGAVVAGSIAPLEDCYRPELAPAPEAAFDEHLVFAQALAEAGCDLLLVETVASQSEGLSAVMAAEQTGLPFWVSCMAMPDGRMRDGSDLRAFVRVAGEKAAAVLINCTPCAGIDRSLDALLETRLPAGAYAHMGDVDPNAGWPPSPLLSPDEYAGRARSWIDRGAVIVGGCCGTTPAHIAALARISPVRHDPCHPLRRLTP